jgi:PAS domain S-box-containing protein
MDNAKIMIVEDEGIVAADIAWQLTDLGYDVVATACSGEEAVDKADKLHPDLVLMDILLTGKMDGIKAADIIRSRWDIPIVFLTAYADQKWLDLAKMVHPFGYILKPFKKNDLKIATEIALYISKADKERRNAEEELLKSKMQYEELYQHGSECYAIIDGETGRFTQPNQAMLKVLGYSIKELEGLRLLDIADEADREYVAHSYKARLEKNASKNYSINYDCWIKTKAGEKRHMNISESRPSFIHGTFLSAIDFTEQEKIKQSLMQSEKLSSLGQLAAGLAHELRNPLAVISSCAQFCLDNMSLAHPVNENLQMIYRSSQRASELINNLLEFAKPSHMEWGLVDINELVTRMWHMAELEATPFQISFEKQLKEGLPKIMGDADKLGQVFLNLFLNAIQAISSKGKILVKTHFLPSNRMVNVKVIDDGHGIPKDYRLKIFDPFFTTKDCGTGLGLSICHSIVQQHKGSITIDNDNKHGTTVSVRLPVSQDRRE